MSTLNSQRNRADLGRRNRRTVLASIAQDGPLPRTEIAQATDLTMASVSRITRELIEADLVQELPDEVQEDCRRGPGRRFVQLDLNPDGGWVVGIGLNIFSQSVTLADLKNRRIARKDLKLGDLSDPDTVIARLAAEANAMIADHVPNRQRLLGAGISITGTVNPLAGVVQTSPYLGWGVVSLGDRLSDALGIPVRVESQPNSQALAEHRFGVARGMNNLLVFNCNLGIGASLMIDGTIARGRGYLAGMIGSTVPPGYAPQTLDELAGGIGILQRLHGGQGNVNTMASNQMADMLHAAIENARLGNADAIGAITQAGQFLGETVSQLVGFIQPDAVLITGPVVGSRHYADACKTAIHANAANQQTSFLTGHMTAQATARWLAIGEFLMERDLDLDSLKMSKAA